MFAYCGNNPVSGYDPIGEWNWGGFITGLGIIAATVITVASLGTLTVVGALVASAAITTGATMSYAAATDSAMVMDVSASVQIGPTPFYGKVGASLIVDFSENGGVYGYGHAGFGVGISSGVSYSVGEVRNLEKPEDYSGAFHDYNVSENVGVDHCYSPTKNYKNTTKAFSITFGTSLAFGVGYDEYSIPIVLFKKRARERIQ